MNRLFIGDRVDPIQTISNFFSWHVDFKPQFNDNFLIWYKFSLILKQILVFNNNRYGISEFVLAVVPQVWWVSDWIDYCSWVPEQDNNFEIILIEKFVIYLEKRGILYLTGSDLLRLFILLWQIWMLLFKKCNTGQKYKWFVSKHIFVLFIDTYLYQNQNGLKWSKVMNKLLII